MWVHDLADADPRCGGKAVGLARLLAAGLPVPAGFVIDARAFAHVLGDVALDDPDAIGHVLGAAAARIAETALPAELVREVDARTAALGTVVVRSSATIEDGAAGAAAGVFSSRGKVAPADVWAAIRAVWASALTPLAAAYARRRGGAISIGVIVQRYVPGELLTVYTRPPGAPTSDEVLLQRRGVIERLPRDPQTASVPAALALRAELAIGATQGADVELVDGVLVQARPIVHPVAHVRTPAPPAVLAPLVADGRTWTWDIAHNPDPLSTTQAELVERVERAGIAPWSLRVCAGFLYTAPRPPPLAGPRIAVPTDPAAVTAHVADVERRLATIVDTADALSIEDALARYLAFYEIWAWELAPLIAALRVRSQPTRTHRPSAVEATLAAAAHGERSEADVIAELGVLSPAWDIAVPTYAERPGLLHAAIARAKTLEPPSVTRHTRAADLAADLAERDDLWFSRAQWLVRRAVLARADALQIDRDDACWISFAALAAGLDHDDAHRRAAAARSASVRAARWTFPIVVGGPPPPEGVALHGVGTGPRVTGRVVRFASLGSAVAVGAGDIVVTRAVTPALAILVIGCAALISETGGLLDHGAALARELGVPCVVGCHDAWSRLSDGTLVTVDGDAGTVEMMIEITEALPRDPQSSSS